METNHFMFEDNSYDLAGLIQDYHTILQVDKNQLVNSIRNEGDESLQQFFVNVDNQSYEEVMSDFIDEHVYVENRNVIKLETEISRVKDKLEKDDNYNISFQSLGENNRINYNQITYTKDTSNDEAEIIIAIRSIDTLIKKELTEITTIERMRQYEKDKEDMEELFQSIGASQWSIQFDDEGDILSCNWSNSLRRMLGFRDEKDFPNVLEAWTDRIHPEDKERIYKEYKTVIEDASVERLFDENMRVLTNRNTYIWIRGVGRVSRRRNNRPALFIGMFININDVKIAADALQEQFMIVHALSMDFKNIFLIDLNDSWASVIKMDGEMLSDYARDPNKRYPYEALIQKYVYESVYQEDKDSLIQEMALSNVIEKLKDSEDYVSSYRTYENGEIHYYQFKFSMLSGTAEDKIIVGFKNIDAVVAATKERENLKKLSEIDMMTNLLNRGSGQNMTEQALQDGECGMLCLLDVDCFKYFNDTYGHDVGDKVLVGVAKCLKKTFRDNDIVFRLGGDEFALYALNVDNEELGRKVLKRFINHLEQLKIPEIGEDEITVSVGAIIIDNPAAHSFAELYKKVDSCTYIAKQATGNTMTFYNI